jgi:hypothetical protein
MKPLYSQTWQKSLDWLLEVDPENPGVRYFALTELLGRPQDDPDLTAARQDVMNHGPVPVILSNQDAKGFWVEPGPGYAPKYRGTVWQIIFLAQLGADGNHPQIKKGCDYLLEHAISRHGAFSMNGAPSGQIHCLEGNLAAAMIDLNRLGDERLNGALDWLARSVTGEGIAPAEEKKADVRYLRSGNSAPGFACSANNHQPCAWGAVKAMLALSKVPEAARTPPMEDAIQTGVNFLLGSDPATAEYPMGYSEKPNRSWFRFGYPIGYITDILQNLEVLTALGCGSDPRLAKALELLLSKGDDQGRWKMEYSYNGKTWIGIEEKDQPSKWVTLRALRVLQKVEG